MPTILLPLIPGTLPAGVCYSSEQERLSDFAANLQAQLDGATFFNYGNTKPAVEFNGFPWLRTTDMRWYYFSGDWLSPNPETSAFVRRLFVGSTVDLQTYDGGDTDPVGASSGPMWEVDTDFEGKSPMGPGTLPLSGTIVTVANDFGVDQVALTALQLPTPIPLIGTTNNWGSGATTPAPFRLLSDDNYVDGTVNVSTDFSITGGGQRHENLHPVRGTYVIKRTARLNYKIP